jgi:hypothetical protein
MEFDPSQKSLIIFLPFWLAIAPVHHGRAVRHVSEILQVGKHHEPRPSKKKAHSRMESKIAGIHPMGIIIPHDRLSLTALHGLIEEFVTRDGTDTGYMDNSFFVLIAISSPVLGFLPT